MFLLISVFFLDYLTDFFNSEGLDGIAAFGRPDGFFKRPRSIEIAVALNRMRQLQIQHQPTPQTQRQPATPSAVGGAGPGSDPGPVAGVPLPGVAPASGGTE